MKISLYTLLGKEYKLNEIINLALKIGFHAIDVRLCEDGVHIKSNISVGEIEDIKK